MPEHDFPRVLLVEDSSLQARATTTYLQARGYPVQVAYTVQAAFAQLEHQDVVLLDILLPDGSGYQVLDHIRTQKLPLKVLVLSQLGAVSDRVKRLKF